MAIAFDAHGEASLVNPATQIDITITLAAGADCVIVGGFDDTGGASLITGVALDPTGVNQAFTKVAGIQTPTDRWETAWRLVGPSVTGSRTIRATASGSCALRFGAQSFTGVDQTNPIDSFNTGTQAFVASPNPFVIATTVVASGCWLVAAVKDGGTTNSYTPTGSETDSPNGQHLWHSNGTVGTGSQSLSIGYSGSNFYGAILLSLAPVSGAAAGHPTMRRWGGIPGMHNSGHGRSWLGDTDGSRFHSH